jgi:hypothetical protein
VWFVNNGREKARTPNISMIKALWGLIKSMKSAVIWTLIGWATERTKNLVPSLCALWMFCVEIFNNIFRKDMPLDKVFSVCTNCITAMYASLRGHIFPPVASPSPLNRFQLIRCGLSELNIRDWINFGSVIPMLSLFLTKLKPIIKFFPKLYKKIQE